MLKNEFNFLDDLFTFGKYEGLTLSTVLDINPDYVKWCVLNVDTPLFLLFDTAIYQIRKAYPEFIIDKDFNFARICKLRKYNVLEYKERKRSRENSYDFLYDRDYDTYERYSGTYAQDEAGYSDDDIDTIFDGDADAYWNID